MLLQLMEDALVALQQSLESANQQRDAAVDNMSQDERIEVRQMINSLHVRLVNLQEHLDERKRCVVDLSYVVVRRRYCEVSLNRIV